jgi:hypothetical protein
MEMAPKQIQGENLMKRSLVVATLVFCTVVSGALWAQDNPFVGTWKLNTAKSKSEPGPGPKSLTRTITAQGAGANYSFEGVSGSGASVAYSFSTNYDGKDSAITGTGAPGGADTVALKRVSSHKVEGTLKKGGKEIGTVVAELSSDGKVSTVHSTGKTGEGKAYSSVSVYEKQ